MRQFLARLSKHPRARSIVISRISEEKLARWAAHITRGGFHYSVPERKGSRRRRGRGDDLPSHARPTTGRGGGGCAETPSHPSNIRMLQKRRLVGLPENDGFFGRQKAFRQLQIIVLIHSQQRPNRIGINTGPHLSKILLDLCRPRQPVWSIGHR